MRWQKFITAQVSTGVKSWGNKSEQRNKLTLFRIPYGNVELHRERIHWATECYTGLCWPTYLPILRRNRPYFENVFTSDFLITTIRRNWGQTKCLSGQTFFYKVLEKHPKSSIVSVGPFTSVSPTEIQWKLLSECKQNVKCCGYLQRDWKCLWLHQCKKFSSWRQHNGLCPANVNMLNRSLEQIVLSSC